MQSRNKLILLIMILCLSLMLIGCSNSSSENATTEENNQSTSESTQKNNDSSNTTENTTLLNENEQDEIEQIDVSTLPIVKMNIKDMGTIELALFPDIAPNTVNNFISLAQSGFYDGLIFHRVINEFMIQGGDPTGTGTGGPGYSIKGEFSSNKFDNPISHTEGIISMARSNHPDSAGSQFFIVHKDSTFLDGEYAAFGVVIEGLEVVDKIATTETDSSDRPKKDVIIESVTVELNGYEAKEPEKM